MYLSRTTKIDASTGSRTTYYLSTYYLHLTGETLLTIPTLGNTAGADRISLNPRRIDLTFEFDVEREWQPVAAWLACILRFANISLNHNPH